MGRRGPKPEAAEVKSQKSAVRSARKPRARAASDDAVAAAGGVSPPACLKGDALTIWRRLAPTLQAAKLLTAVDRETFARYCRNFARWHKMQTVLDTEGETYETVTYGAGGDSDGERPASKLKRAHPAFLIADRLERQLLAAEDRFGLNPAERQRIFVARAATGVTGDLFDQPARRPDDPAADPAKPAQPDDCPIGLLN
jgi:P27 family predicted phage terminase small subunit